MAYTRGEGRSSQVVLFRLGAMSLFVGTVIGTAMQKTAKVVVNRMFLHPHVLKVSGNEKKQS